jgi:hypothetical protein
MSFEKCAKTADYRRTLGSGEEAAALVGEPYNEAELYSIMARGADFVTATATLQESSW